MCAVWRKNYPQGKELMLVDSTCAMQMVKQGTG